jgi:hypothetical protein
VKAQGTVRRANGLAPYGAALTLLAGIALGLIPFSAPASADDRPRPPVAQADVSREREVERQRAVAGELKRQAELQRNVQALQANELQREIQRQTERLRQESLVAGARVDRQPARAGGKPVNPTVGVPISLQACNDSTPQEALAPFGLSSLLIGKAWITKNRGVGEALIRGTHVELSVGGVPVANAERFFADPAPFDHPLLGRVWITRWQYPFTMTTPAPIAVSVRWTLEPRLADFAIFNEDGTPLRYPADFTVALACTLVPAVAVNGRITGAGAGLSDGRVAVYDATSSLVVAVADTNASGEFAVLLRPGAYRFFFFSVAGPWLPEWWDNKTSFNDATTVTLAFGVTPPQLNADLARGVIVSGRVTDADTHAGVPGVGVSAQRADVPCCVFFGASTGADGRYHMVVAQNVTVKVGFHPEGGAIPYLEQWWNARPSFNEADAVVIGTTDIANIDAALERGVFVRGRVTDAETGLPLANASVSASVVGGACCQNFFASTNAQGEYAMAVRTNVSIVVGFFPPISAIPYVPSYWNGRRSFSEADQLVVGTLDIPGIDGALERGVFLSGRVTDASSGAGVGAVTVYASATLCCEAFFGFTASDGTYAMAVRKNITLVVQFFPPFQSPIPYVTQWFHGRTSFATADPVVVTTLDVAGIDAALERGVFLRGHVTDAGTGAPIVLANVNVSPAGVPCCESSFASTDAHGDYAVAVRKNVVVTVMFSAPFESQTPYLQQWYHGKPTFDTADPVTVGSSDVFGIDAALERGVFVRGHVTDADTHAVISGVSVAAYVAAAGCCPLGTFASTDSHGDYRIIARQGVGLKVYFSPPFWSGIPYIGQWYNAKASFDVADVVPVGITDVAGIDAALERGVFLSGRVTDALSGAGVANVSVNAQRIDAQCCEVFYNSTNSDGNYAITVRRGITVKVGFFPSLNDPFPHLSEYWHDRRSFAEADPVAIGTTDVGGIDAALERGTFISGRVTDAATGLGVSGAYVAALGVDPGNEFVGSVPTRPDGTYSITVGPGDYKIGFNPPFGSDLVFEYFDDKTEFSAADVVVVGPTGASGIDAALDHGVRVSGRVLDPEGRAVLPWANVDLVDPLSGAWLAGIGTNADGTYSLTVRPGSYKVDFVPPLGSDLLIEYYNDKATFAEADVLNAVVGTPLANIDATLERGVMLSGRVTDAASRLGVQGVNVSVQTAVCCAGVAGTQSGVDGTYSIALRSGDYKVGFFPPPSAGVVGEFYDDKTSFDTADVVHIGAAPVTGIDAVLEPSGDTTRPLIVDARITQNLITTNFAERGDAFSLTFSEPMNTATRGATLFIADQDGTLVRLDCGFPPNNVACVWDVPGVTVTVTVDVEQLEVPAIGTVGGGTTPGMQIPFNYIGQGGVVDLSGNLPDLDASPDLLVDYE